MKSLEQYIKEDRKFDYIFGDLTDIPISESLTEQLWAFVNKILQMSFKVLKPDGKFMTHVRIFQFQEIFGPKLKFLLVPAERFVVSWCNREVQVAVGQDAAASQVHDLKGIRALLHGGLGILSGVARPEQERIAYRYD